MTQLTLSRRHIILGLSQLAVAAGFPLPDCEQNDLILNRSVSIEAVSWAVIYRELVDVFVEVYGQTLKPNSFWDALLQLQAEHLWQVMKLASRNAAIDLNGPERWERVLGFPLGEVGWRALKKAS